MSDLRWPEDRDAIVAAIRGNSPMLGTRSIARCLADEADALNERVRLLEAVAEAADYLRDGSDTLTPDGDLAYNVLLAALDALKEAPDA